MKDHEIVDDTVHETVVITKENKKNIEKKKTDELREKKRLELLQKKEEEDKHIKLAWTTFLEDKKDELLRLENLKLQNELESALIKQRENEKYLNASTQDDTLVCKICMSEQVSVIVDPCRHVKYCEDCITDWIRINGTCPDCRIPITLSSISKIFT